ncbi:hypothetical protein A2U01_0076202, partial [Trifolium medium]|nr:hypothetical protein [Trifolium medium]
VHVSEVRDNDQRLEWASSQE